MKFCDINPYIRFFWTRTVGEEYSEALLAYDFRIFYCISGSFFVEAEGKSIEIRPHFFAVIPPETPYRLVRASDCGEPIFHVINFDMSCRRSDHKMTIRPQPKRDFDPQLVISRDCPYELSRTIVLEGNYRTGDLMSEIGRLFASRPSLYREESGALLKQALTIAMRKVCNEGSETPRVINEIIAYIRENYCQPVTNIDIARRFRYHPNHISRLFKEHTGKSLHNYIITYRLKIAKELLVGTDYRIDEIARMSGFDSVSYFTQYFKREFGEPPLRFRLNSANNSIK